MTAVPDHIDVAAYVLGILDADEVEYFENHLTQCRRCALDLRDFAELPDLIDEADAGGMLRGTAPERPDGKSVRAMLDSVAESRRRQRWCAVRSAIAAAAVLVAVTVLVTTMVTSPGAPANSAAPPQSPAPARSNVSQRAPDAFTHTGEETRNPGTGVSAKISARDEESGTSVELEVSGRAGQGKCALVAVSRTDRSIQVTTWFMPAPVGGDPGRLRLMGNVAMRWHDIARFKIEDDQGRLLLEILA